jgi:hypothetical protein
VPTIGKIKARNTREGIAKTIGEIIRSFSDKEKPKPRKKPRRKTSAKEMDDLRRKLIQIGK